MQHNVSPLSPAMRGRSADASAATSPGMAHTAQALSHYQIIRRNGAVVPFEPNKIAVAMMKAFLAVHGTQGAASASVREVVDELTQGVVRALMRSRPGGGTFHIEDVQDQVELGLMRGGHHEIARAYVLYRERRAQERARQGASDAPVAPALHVQDGGQRTLFDPARLRGMIEQACAGLGPDVPAEPIFAETMRNLYDGVPLDEIHKAAILAARTLIEKDPAYSFAAARLLLHTIAREVLGRGVATAALAERYVDYFPAFIRRGVEAELLDERLLQFDLPRLAAALKAERDLNFDYLGLQTLYDRYFLHVKKTRIELPQAFFMRVAMGLALGEIDREARAIEFYEVLSSFDFMSSTPTLFNSGTQRSQLSSCYLTTVPDHLDGIYESIKENALLSKFAGGLGNDWTRVRALGSHIKGTNGESQGVVPFLKVVNDTAVAVNQCFAPDTLLFTADGVKAIRDVKTGELVLAQRGEYREVVQQMVYNQTDPMVEIDVKHSIRPLKVTAGHPLWAIRGVPMEQDTARTLRWLEQGKVAPQWVDAGTLARGDYVAQVIPQEVVPVAGFGEDDARLYGILLGDGHMSADEDEWGVSGNPACDTHLAFVRSYLEQRGIHCWERVRGTNYLQLHWSIGCGVAREASTGRLVRGTGAPHLPFQRADLYDEQGSKRIARRLAHLPRTQTLALVRGLLETDGCVSRGKEISFTNTSEPLVEGLRYQLLRLGVPTAGQYRERAQSHEGTRCDGSQVRIDGTTKVYDLRIPAVPEVAALVGAQPIVKRNWIEHDGSLFTRVRSVRHIEPVPFVVDLKVDGDPSYMTTSALAHNGGKRKGAVCTYLETWHLDIEEFLELRKNTGDDRRRTHDMNTANWIPDLFMRRVLEQGEWTLFSPSDVPDLHDKFGAEFEAAYVAYEQKAERGELRLHRRLPATDLWRKMLSMLFETGHPWITFKDACNVRSPQQHVGVVHSSNLCTEITLNTSDSEIAVCNLGSVNLKRHLKDDGEHGRTLDHEKLRATISTAMRMLDNVIDINYYAVKKARDSNLRHRPVGLGIMAFQDCLYELRIPYASDAAVQFADESMEAVCYYAYLASTELARERGRYSSYPGSLWDRGVLPLDTLELLAQARGTSRDGQQPYVEVDRSARLDWDALRHRIASDGMRNSNCVAIAPTATISNIVGVDASIEPSFGNLSVKSNLSGEFTVINSYLVRDLKRCDLWDDVMVMDLKHFNGSLGPIDRVPQELKALYATAFEVESRWLVEAAARRQKWIDQAQSLNIYMAGASGKKLDETYKLAWLRGLKTTYYLRTQSATHVEMSTVNRSQLNSVTSNEDTVRHRAAPMATGIEVSEPADMAASDVRFCALDDPGCEACQ